MSKWEIESANTASGHVNRLLSVGWEPFAVSPESDERYAVIWFKRLKQPENCVGCERSDVGHLPGCRGKVSPKGGNKDE